MKSKAYTSPLKHFEMKKYFIILTIAFVSCKSENKTEKDLESFIVDRVWLSSLNKEQYYLSSKDKREFLWMTFEYRENGTYTPFVNAKGNPESNPLKKISSVYREGWSPLDFYKIEKDKIIFQNEKDVDAANLSEYQIEIGKDTILGVFEYNTLLVKNVNGVRIWKSKK